VFGYLVTWMWVVLFWNSPVISLVRECRIYGRTR
jgi:hypothetical protein